MNAITPLSAVRQLVLGDAGGPSRLTQMIFRFREPAAGRAAIEVCRMPSVLAVAVTTQLPDEEGSMIKFSMPACPDAP